VIGLASYADSPMAVLKGRTDEPVGIYRITRHPFIWGVALIALGHVFLVKTLAGNIYFLGFFIFALFGAWHQDRKLIKKKGKKYQELIAMTSYFPFLAVLSGKQKLIFHELRLAVIIIAFIVSVFACKIHNYMHKGSEYVFAAITVGMAFFFFWTLVSSPIRLYDTIISIIKYEQRRHSRRRTRQRNWH